MRVGEKSYLNGSRSLPNSFRFGGLCDGGVKYNLKLIVTSNRLTVDGVSSEDICSAGIMVHACKANYLLLKASLRRGMVESIAKKESVCLQQSRPH